MGLALPKNRQWVLEVVPPQPKVMEEAYKHYGKLEVVGKGSNPDIISWAREMGVAGWYKDDDIPWCGLFVGICIKRAGYIVPRDSLRSRSWVNYGVRVKKGLEMYSDVMVFWRGTPNSGLGHVGFYVGENKTQFQIYGGNQGNKVGFTWIEKDRLIGAFRHIWKIGQPPSVKKYWLDEKGIPSTNEQ
jgi:uncharacterized protein (TIGR02594 family)